MRPSVSSRSVPALLPLAAIAMVAAIAPARVRGQDFWLVKTRACRQVLGSDPWPGMEAARLDAGGRLVPAPPGMIPALAATRPVVVIVHGMYIPTDRGVCEGLCAAAALPIPPGAVVVVFDWPNVRAHLGIRRDLEELGRRQFVAGYHLARFLQGFPAGARVAVLGHSGGCRAMFAALHLLGGGVLAPGDGEPAVALPGPLPRLHLRAVAVAASVDRHWLVPGERLGRALPATEAVLNLYNPRDRALAFYRLEHYGEFRPALGRRGLRDGDLDRLGPLAARYDQRNVRPWLGGRHHFARTVSQPQVASWIAPYVWASGPFR